MGGYHLGFLSVPLSFSLSKFSSPLIFSACLFPSCSFIIQKRNRAMQGRSQSRKGKTRRKERKREGGSRGREEEGDRKGIEPLLRSSLSFSCPNW